MERATRKTTAKLCSMLVIAGPIVAMDHHMETSRKTYHVGLAFPMYLCFQQLVSALFPLNMGYASVMASMMSPFTLLRFNTIEMKTIAAYVREYLMSIFRYAM